MLPVPDRGREEGCDWSVARLREMQRGERSQRRKAFHEHWSAIQVGGHCDDGLVKHWAPEDVQIRDLCLLQYDYEGRLEYPLARLSQGVPLMDVMRDLQRHLLAPPAIGLHLHAHSLGPINSLGPGNASTWRRARSSILKAENARASGQAGDQDMHLARLVHVPLVDVYR